MKIRMSSILFTVLFSLTLLPATVQAQPGMPLWTNRYNTSELFEYSAGPVAVDAIGNIYVTGRVRVPGSPYYYYYYCDFLKITLSSSGVPLWTNRYNAPANNRIDPRGVMQTDSSGNVYVTGNSYAANDYADYVTIKYSSAGVPLWTRRYNGPVDGWDEPKGLVVDTNDNVYVTGYSESKAGAYGEDFLTIKYSGDGVPLWTNRYNGPQNDSDAAWAIALAPSGNIVVVGESSNLSGKGYLTLAYSSAGTLLWTNSYIKDNGPGNTTGTAHKVAVDPSGDIYVSGFSYGGSTAMDYATIKYSSAGVPLWTNRYNGPKNHTDQATGLALDSNGNVYVTGFSSNKTNYDCATVAYSSTGLQLWVRRYNGPANDDIMGGIVVARNGHVVVAGQEMRNSSGTSWNYDYLTLMYSSTGVPVWTNHYNGSGNGSDSIGGVAVDESGSVVVTGGSVGTSGYEIITIKYADVSAAPAITRQPLSRTNFTGTTATFSVTATGDAPLNYQWRKGGTNLLNGGRVSGVTTTNLQIADVQLADAAGYSVVVTNFSGSVTSSLAQLTVVSPGRFTGLSYSPVNGITLIFRDATVGQPYRIQTSTSLAPASWVDWMSVNYTGPMGLFDLGAVEATNKFYRAVSP